MVEEERSLLVNNAWFKHVVWTLFKEFQEEGFHWDAVAGNAIIFVVVFFHKGAEVNNKKAAATVKRLDEELQVAGCILGKSEGPP